MIDRQTWAKCLVVLLLSTTATTAHAQDKPQDAGTFDPGDDIIVTAQKRSERLVDVPMSVTAATGDQLSRQESSTPHSSQRSFQASPISRATMATRCSRSVGSVSSTTP